MSFASVRITDLDFANDAVIITETTEVLLEAIESVMEEAEPSGLLISCIITKVRAFGDILNPAIESMLVSGENVEVTQMFTYIGSVIY